MPRKILGLGLEADCAEMVSGSALVPLRVIQDFGIGASQRSSPLHSAAAATAI
jgi:hypothetical protein